MTLFDRILKARGINRNSIADFILPDYSLLHNPFLLSDMDKAVERLIFAHKNQDKIMIYGDYDIDGLTASALLLDAFSSFGFKNVDVFIPNRFVEGYGLTIDAIENIYESGVNLIVTVDCGSHSNKEIIRANDLGVDVIVTDHHNIGKIIPKSIAVINPKRLDNRYPFVDLAGVGVAFKLVQAMQTRLEGLPIGQEKWLLDLVALGTVCDVVELIDENRTFVYWGLKVLAKTTRLGLKALMAVSAVEPESVNARSLGFRLGPRMNASGRLETAQHAFDMLTTNEPMIALEKVEYLDSLNKIRRYDQDKILKQAIIQSEKYTDNPVLVVGGKDWNHGIVGIVAAKLLEKYKKPAFVFQIMGENSKGSARSYGDFSAINAIYHCNDIITKGGGHDIAAGFIIPTSSIDIFRKKINLYYKNLKLKNQQLKLLPKADTIVDLSELTEEIVGLIDQLEPFGIGNLQPVLKSENLLVINVRKMGDNSQHIKLDLEDENGIKMQFVAFNALDYFFVEFGEKVSVWYHVNVNEWHGNRSVEGQLLHLEIIK